MKYLPVVYKPSCERASERASAFWPLAILVSLAFTGKNDLNHSMPQQVGATHRGVARNFQRGGGRGHTVSNIIVMAFSP